MTLSIEDLKKLSVKRLIALRNKSYKSGCYYQEPWERSIPISYIVEELNTREHVERRKKNNV